MRAPSIGLLLPTRELLLADAASPEPLLSLARDAEAAGLASLPGIPVPPTLSRIW